MNSSIQLLHNEYLCILKLGNYNCEVVHNEYEPNYLEPLRLAAVSSDGLRLIWAVAGLLCRG